MKRIINFVCCMMLLITALQAQTTPEQNDAKVKAEIRALIEQLNEAGLKKDEKTWDRILAPGFMITHQYTDKLVDKAAILKEVAKGGMSAPPEMKIVMSVEDLEVAHTPQTVVAVYHFVTKTQTKDELFIQRSRAMSFFVRNGTSWQLLAEQEKVLPPIRPTKKIETKALDAIVGEYQAEEGMVVVVTREGDKLFSQKTGNPKFELIPANDTTFYARVMAEAESSYTFVRDENGKVTHMVIQNPPPVSVVFVRKKIK